MVLKIKKIQKSRTLTNDLADTLRSQIIQEKWATGAKLPPSKDIEKAASVSRTVVREAVAVLKAEGLLESKQGVGVFVSEAKRNKRFVISEEEFNSYENAIKILELRMAVEIEMSGMAALNHSASDIHKINNVLHIINDKMSKGQDARKEDFDFHLAIANASGNHYFTRFIEFIGSGVIPSRELITKHSDPKEPQQYYDIICQEHTNIATAIEAKDALLAKRFMAEHLGNSKKRHTTIYERALVQ